METGTTDAVLVERARSGDDSAFADLYDRWSDRVHSLCTRVLDGDAHEAGDALHDTFLVAWDRLDQLRDPDRVGPWLLAIARHESIRRGKRRARARPVETMTDVASTDAEPDAGADSDALSRVVWDAAASLNSRDKALLELSLVQQIEGRDLASAAGVDHSQLHVVLARMREHLGSAITALHVARTGRTDCATLAELLGSWDGAFSSVVRKRVARHLRACGVCDERGRSANPLVLGLALPLAPAPAALRSRVISSIGDAPAPGAGAFGHDPDGFPTERRARRPLLGAAVAAVIALVITVLVFAGGQEERRQVAAAPTPGATTSTTDRPERDPATTGVSTTTTEEPAETTPESEPDGLAIGAASSVPSQTVSPGPAPVPPAPSETTTTTTSAPPPPPDNDVPVFGSVTVTPDTIHESGGCGPEVVTVTAVVTDASPMTVTATMHVQGEVVRTRQLTWNGSTWTGSFGPFDSGSVTGDNNAVSADIRVTAVDHPPGAGGPNQTQDSGHYVLVNAC
ncbi:RNA polymerase sigma factor [Actinospongicola halichondriae]|uniref:RNA polymerase sigma factor n=1 Tax=Actinospongicola halichondriae TaxID=3236844 RepID=UPI003D372AAE